MSGRAQPFLDHGLGTVPRVLGLADRADGSATFGCADRAFWHYRQSDFCNVRFQEAGWLLALAAVTPAPGNRFHGKRRMMEWARSLWRFWLSRRNRDGSVAEAYPHERSFCATAFTARAFVETVKLAGGAAGWAAELEQAERTFRWLGANANPDTANQMAASLHALSGYAALTGDADAGAAARTRRDQVLALMVGDGAFGEYGGLDVGYQSLTVSCLIGAARAGGKVDGGKQDGALIETAAKAAARIDPLIDAQGRHDPAANSRKTGFLYPSGLAALKCGVTERMATGIEAGTLLVPRWLDDRYCIGLATDYLLAAREFSDADDHG